MCRARRALGSLEDAVEGDEHPQRAKRTTGERFFGDDRSVRVMVTGGAGFIGSNIVRRLHELGHEPVVLDDISSGYRENLLRTSPSLKATCAAASRSRPPWTGAASPRTWPPASATRGRSPNRRPPPWLT